MVEDCQAILHKRTNGYQPEEEASMLPRTALPGQARSLCSSSVLSLVIELFAPIVLLSDSSSKRYCFPLHPPIKVRGDLSGRNMIGGFGRFAEFQRKRGRPVVKCFCLTFMVVASSRYLSGEAIVSHLDVDHSRISHTINVDKRLS